jgi:ATP-dependent Clp protease ATP-binding subunit ClpA
LPLLNYRNVTLQTVFPDKAIDLMDEAASKSEWKLQNLRNLMFDRKIMQLEIEAIKGKDE